jgi:DUF4097 and DUF4098 domain-containing protein YvlB
MTRATRVTSVILLTGITLMLTSCKQGRFSVNGYQFDRRGETANRHEQGPISADLRSLKVDNQFGHVRVAVADGDPHWTWNLTCWADSQETAREFTERITLRLDEEAGNGCWTLVLPPPPVPELRGVESNLSLAVPATMRVEVVNRHGDTEIQGVSGGTHARCQHGDLRLISLAGEIDVETSFGALRAEGLSGGRLANRHGSISALDTSGDLKVESRHGDVEIHCVLGGVTVDNAHGKVTAEQVAGPATITTSFAAIRVDDIGAEAILRNDHGDISGRQLGGNAQVKTAFGEIDLDVACPLLECTNRHGPIKLNLTGSAVRSVNAQTSFGDLRVTVPASCDPRIQAVTSFGEVRSDIPLDAAEATAEQSPDMPEKLRMTLKNQHGDIRVERSAD